MVNQRIALVVDDELDIVNLIKELLKNELHYLTLSTTNPEEAVHLAETYLFDLLILDLNMPKLDGLKVLELVRAKQPAVKVIIVTGLHDKYKEQLKHCVYDKIIEKPFDFGTLKYHVVSVAGEVDLKLKENESKIIPKAKVLLMGSSKSQNEQLRGFILEDNPNFYEVEAAHTASDALTIIRNFKPNAFITNLDFFGEDNRKILDAFRQSLEGQPKVEIVVASNHDLEKNRGVDIGNSIVLMKPFHTEDLLEKLRAKCAEVGLIKKLTFF